MTATPWSPGTATGIGSLPGTDAAEALRLVSGELPGLPHLPELPDRGVRAQLIGRAAALLMDLPVEIVPTGWAFTEHASRDLRQARDFLAWDLDALTEHGDPGAGVFKVQVAGPWTLAASIELRSGHKVLSDAGARRDLAQSLAAGVAAHVADVARRLDAGTKIVLQLDEPLVDAVLAGRVSTPSGLGSVAVVEENVVADVLSEVLAASGAAATAIHCCATDSPLAVLGRTGADAVGVQLAGLDGRRVDAIGEMLDAGRSIWLGVVPGVDSAGVSADAVLASVRAFWQRLGFAPRLLASSVVLTPVCGLAGASPVYARTALKAVREAAAALTDLG